MPSSPSSNAWGQPGNQKMLISLTALILTFFLAVVFLLDLLLDLGLLVGTFYILVVVFTLFICPQKLLILCVALLSSIFMVIGYGAGGMPGWEEASARTASMVAIWLSVWLGFMHIREKEANLLLEDRFKQVFNAAPTGLILTDEKGYVTLANPQACVFFAGSVNQIIGRHVSELLPGLTALQRRLADPSGGQVPQAPVETEALRMDGSVFPAEMAQTKMCMLQASFNLISLSDVTGRKHLEQIKDQFTGLVSHEVRTPIAILSAIMEHLRDGVDGTLNEEQAHLVALAKGNIDRLNLILDTLSHYIRFEMGIEKVGLQAMDPGPFIRELSTNFSLLAQKVGKSYSIDIPESLPKIVCNATFLNQILNNLFSNALRHADTRISLSVTVLERASRTGTNYLRCSIANDGQPINQESMEKIFHKFYRIGPQSTSSSLGLGLYLSKKMIEMQKGRIKLESQTGQTVFHVDLPLA